MCCMFSTRVLGSRIHASPSSPHMLYVTLQPKGEPESEDALMQQPGLLRYSEEQDYRKGQANILTVPNTCFFSICSQKKQVWGILRKVFQGSQSFSRGARSAELLTHSNGVLRLTAYQGKGAGQRKGEIRGSLSV